MPRSIDNVPHAVKRSGHALSKAFAEHCAELKKWSVREDGRQPMTDVNACAEALAAVYTDFFRNFAPCVSLEEGLPGIKRGAESAMGHAYTEAWAAFEKLAAEAIARTVPS